MTRWARGSKGIALTDHSGGRARLRYVFDISDTGTREHSRTPWLWKKARYLGYDIRVSRSRDAKRVTKKGLQRVWYGKVQLYMPEEKWIAKLHAYGAFKTKKDGNGKEIWKPLHRGCLMPLDEAATQRGQSHIGKANQGPAARL